VRNARAAAQAGVWRSGVEGGPSSSGNPGLDPGMRVAGANQPQLRNRIVDAALESGGQAGRNADRAEHYRHGAGKILAMALPARKQEVCQRIGSLASRQVERVGVAGAQPSLDGADPLQIRDGAGGEEPCQIRNPAVDGRQLQRALAGGERQHRRGEKGSRLLLPVLQQAVGVVVQTLGKRWLRR